MFRKARIVSIALIVVAGFLTTTTASAAVKISNGVACTKAGATSKTSAGTYKCAKNPIVTNSKLTWLSVDCLNTAKSYIKTKNDLPAIKTATDTTIAEFDAEIIVQQKLLADSLALVIVQQKELVELQKKLVEFRPLALATIETYKAKIVGITATLTTMKADAANLTKNSANIAVYEKAIKNYEIAIKNKEAEIKKFETSIKKFETSITKLTSATGKIPRSINRINTFRAQALASYKNAQLDIKSGLDSTKLICSKGY